MYAINVFCRCLCLTSNLVKTSSSYTFQLYISAYIPFIEPSFISTFVGIFNFRHQNDDFFTFHFFLLQKWIANYCSSMVFVLEFIKIVAQCTSKVNIAKLFSNDKIFNCILWLTKCIEWTRWKLFGI